MRAVVWSVLTALTIALLVVLLFFFGALPAGVKVWLGGLPRDPLAAAGVILQKAPIIVSLLSSPTQDPEAHYPNHRTQDGHIGATLLVLSSRTEAIN